MAALALVALAATALEGCPVDPCEEDPPAPECMPPDPVALLGSVCADTDTGPACTDPSAFAPLDDGAALTVHMGPQGGFHVFLSVRVRSMDPGDPSTNKGSPNNPAVTWTVYLDDVAIGARTLQVGLLPAEEAFYYERSEVAVILDEDVILSPTNVDGRMLRVEMSVTDADGLTATDVAEVVAMGVIG